ncbi:GGDEF domain-containing protein [Streptomyces subrutilus]
MDSVLRAQARFGQRALLLTTAAVPLTGWAVHAVALHKRLAATRRDPLTGLLRRDSYTARARRVLGRHDDVAVVLVDQDHFKAVNDTMGHAAGDAVLAATAARLIAWAGPRASVGRLGGDAFAVVLELSAGRLEQRLAQLVRMPHSPVVLDDGRTVDVGASVGAATPHAVGSRDLSLLQRAADAALYDGKHSGRASLALSACSPRPETTGPTRTEPPAVAAPFLGGARRGGQLDIDAGEIHRVKEGKTSKVALGGRRRLVARPPDRTARSPPGARRSVFYGADRTGRPAAPSAPPAAPRRHQHDAGGTQH